jgi:hypothetical protein
MSDVDVRSEMETEGERVRWRESEKGREGESIEWRWVGGSFTPS